MINYLDETETNRTIVLCSKWKPELMREKIDLKLSPFFLDNGVLNIILMHGVLDAHKFKNISVNGYFELL